VVVVTQSVLLLLVFSLVVLRILPLVRFPLALALVRLRSPFGHLAFVLALALLPDLFFLAVAFPSFFISIIASIASSRFFYFCSFSCCFSSFIFPFVIPLIHCSLV
jgi:hypothetical protein